MCVCVSLNLEVWKKANRAKPGSLLGADFSLSSNSITYVAHYVSVEKNLYDEGELTLGIFK